MLPGGGVHFGQFKSIIHSRMRQLFTLEAASSPNNGSLSVRMSIGQQTTMAAITLMYYGRGGNDMVSYGLRRMIIARWRPSSLNQVPRHYAGVPFPNALETNFYWVNKTILPHSDLNFVTLAFC